jgi:hypothetical protein
MYKVFWNKKEPPNQASIECGVDPYSYRRSFVALSGGHRNIEQSPQGFIDDSDHWINTPR